MSHNPGPFLLFDAENRIDPKVCRSEQDLIVAISDLDGQAFQVFTIAVDEFCRDVTHEYAPIEDVEYLEYDRACSKADRGYQLSREAV